MKEPAPLTTREEELQEIKRNEVKTDYSVDSKHQTLSGVAFPITEAARQAICDMVAGSYEYLQFKIGFYSSVVISTVQIIIFLHDL